MNDAAEFFTPRVHDIDSTGAAAINVTGGIDLHPIRAAGLGAVYIDEDAVGLFGECAVRRQVEGANMASAEIIDVEHTFIRRECKPIGENHIIKQKRQGAQIRADSVDAGVGEVPLLAWRGLLHGSVK